VSWHLVLTAIPFGGAFLMAGIGIALRACQPVLYRSAINLSFFYAAAFACASVATFVVLA